MRMIVWVKEVHKQGYVVEADTPEEATKIVADGGGELEEGTFCYSHTLDPETWQVTDMHENTLKEGSAE